MRSFQPDAQQGDLFERVVLEVAAEMLEAGARDDGCGCFGYGAGQLEARWPYERDRSVEVTGPRL
jgi:hypothetical protein